MQDYRKLLQLCHSFSSGTTDDSTPLKLELSDPPYIFEYLKEHTQCFQGK